MHAQDPLQPFPSPHVGSEEGCSRWGSAPLVEGKPSGLWGHHGLHLPREPFLHPIALGSVTQSNGRGVAQPCIPHPSFALEMNGFSYFP